MRKLIDYICNNDICIYNKEPIEMYTEGNTPKLCLGCGNEMKRLPATNITLNLKGEGFYKQGIQ